MYVMLALLLLSVLIIAHEFGHFIAARACGIEVVEFSMGMGPLLFQRRSKRGTLFSLRLFPIGGFCQFYGEDEDRADPRAFNNHRIWKRMLTVVSGPMMNFVIAFAMVIVILSVTGVLVVLPEVAQVEESAAQAGMLVGDELLTVNGIPVKDTSVVTQTVSASGGEPVTFEVLRGGENRSVTITPFYDAEMQRYRVGITFALGRERISLLKSIPFSIQYNLESVKIIVDTLRDLFFNGQGVDQVTGVVGTVYVIQDYTRQGGLDVYLEMLAMISVNLGVMNLLPIPGLDGSRLLFLLAEKLRGKPVRREVEGAIHGIGMIVLLALMALLTYKDIVQIFM